MTATVTGSGGSSPPNKRFRTTRTYHDPRYVIYFEGFLFLPFLCGFTDSCFYSPAHQTRAPCHLPRGPEPRTLQRMVALKAQR
jgi:hypothetical protein